VAERALTRRPAPTERTPGTLEAATADFYRAALRGLADASVPFLVGGAYAFERYTGIARHTKDFDIFVRPDDCGRALEALGAMGYETDLTFPHWLAKAFRGDDFIDLIFGSGNGIAQVDDAWFEHAVDDEVLGVPLRLCPPEETIWSKAFIMERERYDGADIAHLLRAQAARLDWTRLLQRFDRHWRVLLSHLVLFGFVYPSDRDSVPAWVTKELVGRLLQEMESPEPGGRVCRGTLLSRAQYLVDIDHWGYRDSRLGPDATMSRRDVARWTAAIDDD
jgi:putative nucleotidyltransferase-like protein